MLTAMLNPYDLTNWCGAYVGLVAQAMRNCVFTFNLLDPFLAARVAHRMQKNLLLPLLM